MWKILSFSELINSESFSIVSYKQGMSKSLFAEKSQIKLNSLNKKWISNAYLIRQSFKGTVVNRV